MRTLNVCTGVAHRSLDSREGVCNLRTVSQTASHRKMPKFVMNPSLEMRLPLSTEKVRADRSLLKAARVKLSLEQEQLARAAGVTTNTISNFETGKAVAHESTRSAIQQALEARGIVFTNGDKPGFYFDKGKVIIPT